MALIYMDGFDHYTINDSSTYNKQGDRYNQVEAGGGQLATGRRASSYGLNNDNRAIGKSALATGGSQTTGIIGFAYRRREGGSSLRRLCSFTDATGVSIIELHLHPSGTMQVWRPMYTAVYSPISSGGYGDWQGTATPDALLNGVWYYIEWKVGFAKSGGSFTIRVNEEEWTTQTGMQTIASGCPDSTWTGGIGLVGGVSSTEQCDYDDLYVCDGSGGSPFNDFLGDVRIDPHYPTADGFYTDFTPSTGSVHYDMVNEAVTTAGTLNIPDDDTTYNATSTVNAIDTFVCEDFKASGFTLLAVQHLMSQKKLDAGTAAVAPVIRLGGSDAIGTDTYQSEGDYWYARSIYTTNPVSSTTWNESDFNAMEVGYKKTL